MPRRILAQGDRVKTETGDTGTVTDPRPYYDGEHDVIDVLLDYGDGEPGGHPLETLRVIGETDGLVKTPPSRPEPRELNWQDCRDAATDAAANLAHLYANSAGSLEGADLDRWVEEMVQRELRVALRKGLEHYQAEKHETIKRTGDRFK